MKTLNYFDFYSIENIDWGEKTMQLLLRNWPVLIMADGSSVNLLAGTKLTELLGFVITKCKMFCTCWRWFTETNGKVTNIFCFRS